MIVQVQARSRHIYTMFASVGSTGEAVTLCCIILYPI